MSRWIAACVVMAACSTTPSDEVTGPYTGPITRYAIDDIVIPSTTEQVTGFAGDLTGDGHADNQFGQVTRTLREWGDDLTSGGRDMIGSGVIRSFVELQADDLSNDESVAIWYVGASDDSATAVGGRMRAGALTSNRLRASEHLGVARLHLPIFLDADPIEIDLHGLEIELAPDGRGGFDGLVRGGIPHAQLEDAVSAGVLQMFVANPGEHKGLRQLFESSLTVPDDGVITRDEVVNNGLIKSILAPDLQIPGVGDAVSFAFGIHLRTCPDGVCALPAVEDRCRDRVRDGDETDVDCGGGCIPCAASRACSAGDDCQSGTCAATACTAPTCSDGVENGFEGDVDCGGVCPTACTAGQRCDDNADCASQKCALPGFCQ